MTGIRSQVRISVMASLGFCLMLLGLPLLPSAEYLKYDAGDVPVMLMAFAAGPTAGIMVAALKCALFVLVRGGFESYVGAPLSFAWGALFAGSAGAIYRLRKNRTQAIVALVAGTLTSSVGLVLINAWLLPWYLNLLSPGSGTQVSLRLLIGIILPFNLLKGSLSSLLCFAVYKRLSPLLKEG
jgi:riboflavin transporter